MLAVVKNQTDVWFVFLPAVPLETRASAILALTALLILLGLLSTALLGHLLCFHIYLSKCLPDSSMANRGRLPVRGGGAAEPGYHTFSWEPGLRECGDSSLH